MTKSTARAAFGRDASPGQIPGSLPRRCTWRSCYREQYLDLPVCFGHAVVISGAVRGAEFSPNEPPPIQPAYVYYLMVSPSKVKIGFTTNLRDRIINLRSELQYVVAIERGGRDVELRRHKEFAAERFGRREDFRLSERLKQHIEALQPCRDELIGIATTTPM